MIFMIIRVALSGKVFPGRRSHRGTIVSNLGGCILECSDMMCIPCVESLRIVNLDDICV